MERWKSKCPHCGEYHEINFEDIRYEHEESVVAGRKTFKVLSGTSVLAAGVSPTRRP